VLGARGRLGYVAAEAFRDARWDVKGLVRPGRSSFVPRGVEPVEAVTREQAIEAARGCDVVLNAFNPDIIKWRQNAMSLAYSAVAAAEENRATLLFAGSVWNYGAGMPPVLDETTPMRPTTRKGAMRVEMEQRIREACDRGMRAIVLRAGDFFGAGRGSWFDLVITKEMARQRLTYPGPPDVVHAWAYLPDYAGTLVRLADMREQFAAFETFGFPGFAITGRQLVHAIESVTRSSFNVRQMSWWLLRSLGRLLSMGRELAELEYLWRVPHRISGDKLQALLGELPRTPLEDAVRQSLRDLGFRF
jgi:nucleoside-diphosphate-sugar epimerase